MTSAVCTLFEGHYHLGAAALVNSLHASGFRGRVICGYRGPLPPWAQPGSPDASGHHVRDLGDGIQLWFVQLDAKLHFTNYKPTFLLDMWKGPAAGAETFHYLDPDIVLKCPWDVLERWADGGLALCEDVNNYLPPGHPLRTGWKRWLASEGLPVTRTDRDRYYSAGYIGVPRAQASFLETWSDLIARIGRASGSLASLKQGGPNSLFHSQDQDAMNIALMVTGAPVNATGPEGMDFKTGGHLLSHAIGGRKPWLGGFVKQAFQGFPPSTAAKSFMDHLESPIPVFSPAQKRKLQRSLRFAAMVGRFYRRA